MASPQMHHPPANARALHTVCPTLSNLADSTVAPFGSEWPPRPPRPPTQVSSTKKGLPLRNTSSSPRKSSPCLSGGQQSVQTKSGVTAHDTSTDSTSRSKEVFKSSISQPSSSPSTSADIPQASSKHSKENVSVVDSAPRIAFDPPIVFPLKTYSYKNHAPPPSRAYVRNEEDADRLVGGLCGAVGFDIEWKVLFSKGSKMRPAATVQLSDRRTILVIQISAMKAFPRKLKDLLESTDIAKVGVNILNDGKKLARDYGVRPRGLIELGTLARQADAYYIERFFRASETLRKSEPTCTTGDPESKMRKPGTKINLATVTTMYTGCALPKGPVRTSDWEVQPLSETQLDYAANDAHSALVIYDRLISMAKANGVTLRPAEYTSRVESSYNISSEAKSKTAPLRTAPIYQAPVMTSKVSSSSTTSSSMSAGGTTDGATTSASTSSIYSHSSSTVLTCKAREATSNKTRFKPAFPVSYAPVSDSDVEIFGIRDYRSNGHTIITQKSRPARQTEVPSTEPSDRGRTGPRFKPSYNNFPRPTLESTGSEIHETRGISPAKESNRLSSISGDPSPERSPRFKPSYNTTLSRPASPLKQSAISDHATASTSSTESTQPPHRVHQPTHQRAQHIRAYNLWHARQLPLPDICGILRSQDNPLKSSTVISYIVTALQTDSRLRFSRERLRALLASEPKSWLFYRDWFRTLNVVKHINMEVDTKEERGRNTKN